mmetsp:Transcript_22768/g.36920  ORF Transcript_22768/g.36920 Transcript_22768/m.36920 type:complete len:247 (-) Transcript_22768:2359-3099(-)
MVAISEACDRLLIMHTKKSRDSDCGTQRQVEGKAQPLRSSASTMTGHPNQGQERSRSILSSSRNKQRYNKKETGRSNEKHQKDIIFVPSSNQSSMSRKNSSLIMDLKKAVMGEITEPPHQTWYYSSNHVLVNRERMMRGIAPLMRTVALDALARSLAASAASTYHKCGTAQESQVALFPAQCPYEGSMAHGASIRSIHSKMMKSRSKEKERILRATFQQFGVGTYKNEEGVLFLCQLFSKTGRIEF